MKNVLKKWTSLSKNSRDGFINYGIVIVFFVIFQSLLSTKSLSNSLSGQLVPICVYVVVALALNLVVGISGELSLGQAGFMGVGAFTGVIVSTCLQSSISNGPIRLIFAIIFGAMIAGIAGLLIGIPVLRLRGDYLAIVTLAFGEIIKNILNSEHIGEKNADNFLGNYYPVAYFSASVATQPVFCALFCSDDAVGIHYRNLLFSRNYVFS